MADLTLLSNDKNVSFDLTPTQLVERAPGAPDRVLGQVTYSLAISHDGTGAVTTSYSSLRPEIEALLSQASSGSADEMRVYFSGRKFGWTACFTEIVRVSRCWLIIHAPKPMYWYVLEPNTIAIVAFPDEESAQRELLRASELVTHQLLTVPSPMAGSYVHLVPTGERHASDWPVERAATFVGTRFAEANRLTLPLAAQASDFSETECHSVDEAARRTGTWILHQLATGHIVTRLTVNEKVLVLPKPEILATEKAIKESVKASVKVVKDALKAASKGSKKTKTP